MPENRSDTELMPPLSVLGAANPALGAGLHRRVLHFYALGRASEIAEINSVFTTVRGHDCVVDRKKITPNA